MCGVDGVSFVESLPRRLSWENRPGNGRGSRSPHGELKSRRCMRGRHVVENGRFRDSAHTFHSQLQLPHSLPSATLQVSKWCMCPSAPLFGFLSIAHSFQKRSTRSFALCMWGNRQCRVRSTSRVSPVCLPRSHILSSHPVLNTLTSNERRRSQPTGARIWLPQPSPTCCPRRRRGRPRHLHRHQGARYT